MISFYSGTDFADFQVGSTEVLIYFLISLAVAITFYLLRSIGLYVLAKNRSFKYAFVSFIPLAWFFVACKLVGEARFFNKPIEKLAIILTIIYGVSTFITFAVETIAYYPIVGNMLAGNGSWAIGACPEGYYNYDLLVQGIYHRGEFANPYGASLINIGKVLVVLDDINLILGLASIIVEVTVYMGLFRKYIPQHYILFMFLSILFGIFAPLVFAIRKRQPIKYSDYLRSRYSAHGGYGNPYGNPYNNPYNNPNNNGYNGNGYNGGYQAQPKAPFEEFSGKGERDPGDPFEEFNDKDKN